MTSKTIVVILFGIIFGSQDSLKITNDKEVWKLNLIPSITGFVPLGQLENNKPFKAVAIFALRHYWYNEFLIAKEINDISDRNRSFWWMFFLYFYGIIDAYVDSHLDELPEVNEENNLNNLE